jgi:ribose-phosphate pyrophosphokinase
MMLVGDVADRTAILIDDLADTCNTITRAAKLLKKERATKVYALVTHGVFSGDAIERLKASALDMVVTTNSVDQREHKVLLGDQLHVLEVGHVFAEVNFAVLPKLGSVTYMYQAIRRVHHGESISVLFNYD